MEKETLAKDSYENIKKELVKRMVDHQRVIENSKYGKFIIQTNEIQFYLIWLICLRVSYFDEKIKNELDWSELGKLIAYFRICAKNIAELELIKHLKEYKDMRNRLAHKMFTDKKLTSQECEIAIEEGNDLIAILKKLIMEE